METLNKMKEIIEKISIDTNKVVTKKNKSAMIRARKHAQELKTLMPVFRKELLEILKKDHAGS